MNPIQYKKNFFLLVVIFVMNYKICAKENTYVYCVNTKGKWHWLLDTHNNYVQVQGTWGVYELKGGLNFRYFILENAYQKINELKNECQNLFGNDFSFPQPANHNLNLWSLFGYDSNYFFNGVVNFYFSNYTRGIIVSFKFPYFQYMYNGFDFNRI